MGQKEAHELRWDQTALIAEAIVFEPNEMWDTNKNKYGIFSRLKCQSKALPMKIERYKKETQENAKRVLKGD